MNKTIMIAAISVAFVAGTLTAGTWVEAIPTTNEPLHNVESYVPYGTSEYGSILYVKISSDDSYKVDLCVTNNDKKVTSQIQIQQIKDGIKTQSPMLLNTKPNDTNCILFGGSAGEQYLVTNPTIVDIITLDSTSVLFTTTTTSSGKVTIETCNLGEKGPFNCQPL